MPYGTLALDTIDTSGNLTVTGNIATTGTLRPSALQGTAAATPPIFQDSAGTQIGTLVRAWVACNGSTTILRSFNVTSVTDGGVGQITVNFTNPLPSANCAVVATNRYRSSGSFETTVITSAITANSVSTGTADVVSGATVEVPYIAVAVFG